MNLQPLPDNFLRPYQMKGVNQIRAHLGRGDQVICYQAPTGSGKCLGKDTPVLMYDGTIKPVQDILPGDLLMGPDSQPRRVESICRGEEMLHRVVPVKGDSYVVNESHILSLKRTNMGKYPPWTKMSRNKNGRIVNIPVSEYLHKSKTFKHVHKAWRTGVEFAVDNRPRLLDPYFLGVWLGDGTSKDASVTTGDKEIIEYLQYYAEKLNLRTKTKPNSENSVMVCILDYTHRGRGGTSIMNSLRYYKLINNKHVPMPFKTGRREDRLKLLAGIIDTDGHYTKKGFDINLKNEVLLDDIIFIARSLGFAAFKKPSRKICYNNGVAGDYWRCNIHGEGIEEIPCLIPRKQANPRLQIKSPLVTGIKIEPVGIGEYFGFEISGPDRLFLLGDFTVTHNTRVFSYITHGAARKGNTVWILVHRRELLRQASDSLHEMGIYHGMISPLYTADPFAQIQIASIDTLVNRLDKLHPPALVIPDEFHHCVSPTWFKVIKHLISKGTKVIGVTATPERNDKKGLGKLSGGLCDSLIMGPQPQELIDLGYLARPIIFRPTLATTENLHTKFGEFRQDEKEALMDTKKIIGDAVASYSKICRNKPTICFVPSLKMAANVEAQYRAAGFQAAMVEGKMDDRDRKSRIGALGTGGLHVLISCSLIDEGVDVPVVEGIQLLDPTQSLPRFLQRAGRGARMFPGKQGYYLLDHVCNTFMPDMVPNHGDPSWDREWSLDGDVKKKKTDQEKKITTKQCPQCYAVDYSYISQCKQCGHVFVSDGREIDQVEGELEEITLEQIQAMRQQKETERKRAQSYEDLLAIEKARGYKPGWARHVHAARGQRSGARL
jgi:superfamily II DNA or RNA helicase